MRIAIAGATGFIGQKLIERIISSSNHAVNALSRSGNSIIDPRVTPIATDFFSLRDAERGLTGCDIGIYLLHSMSPSNRLSQGDFEDFDFILADNFARAAKKCGLKHIIYVSGMFDPDKLPLSRHLASRLEVESTLAAYDTPLTTLRSSLVIGARGSSFIILKKLVYRLPSMGLPAWVQTPCQPIFIDDLIEVIMRCLGNSRTFGRTYDCGAPEKLSYRTLIEMTARAAGLQRKLVDLPAIPLTLSKLWVRLIAGASKSLVYPLIDSLKTPMLVDPARRLDSELEPMFTPIEKGIALSLDEKLDSKRPLTHRPSEPVRQRSEVRSVQRLTLPRGMDAYQVAQSYFKWLPQFFNLILRVENIEKRSLFRLRGIPKPLLVLSFSPDRSVRDRQLFYITGGLLALASERGRLEFREHPCGTFVFAAVHDFRPSMPWWLYRVTQALVHRFVMWNFGQFLVRLDQRRIKSESLASV